jgi:hypothetical protein
MDNLCIGLVFAILSFVGGFLAGRESGRTETMAKMGGEIIDAVRGKKQ